MHVKLQMKVITQARAKLLFRIVKYKRRAALQFASTNCVVGLLHVRIMLATASTLFFFVAVLL